eukprot:g43024.t1
MKLDGSPGINLGTKNMMVETALLTLQRPPHEHLGASAKLGELSHRLVKQQPDIVIPIESYFTDNIPDIATLDMSYPTARTDPVEM